MKIYSSRTCRLFFAVVLTVHIGGLANVLAQNPPSPLPVETKERQPYSQPLDYVIGPGDLLSLHVFQQPDLSGDVRVSAQGYIRLLFVDEPIMAAGHTDWEMADIIREKLLVILRDPRVSVQVKEARQQEAYILGAVNRPGAYPVSPTTRLLNVVAESGGLSDRAGFIVYILRGNVWTDEHQGELAANGEIRLATVLETVDIREMFLGKVELNKRIYPGDLVHVPDADKVFVGGNVNSPGAFELRTRLTLTQAITLAGGLKPASKKSKVKIIRQERGKNELTELTVNLDKVESNPSQDMQLQANDVIFVPSSTLKNVGLALVNAFAIQSALLPLYLIRR